MQMIFLFIIPKIYVSEIESVSIIYFLIWDQYNTAENNRIVCQLSIFRQLRMFWISTSLNLINKMEHLYIS